MKKSKLKIAVVLGLLCCMAFGMSVMALDRSPSYNISPNQLKRIDNFTPRVSTIRLNTRPVTGGNVTIYLSGVAGGSAVFPYNAPRADWVVSVSDPSEMLTVDGVAGPRGASGTLHICN